MKGVASLVFILAAPAVLSLILSGVSGSSVPNYAALASAVAATIVALSAGAWYAQRWAMGRRTLGWLCGWLLLLTIVSLMVADLMAGLAMMDMGREWPWR